MSQVQQRATILENVQVAQDTWRMRLHCPELAQVILPGQFVMLRSAKGSDPLLGRPFALYDTAFENTAIDVVYLVIGKLTRLMSMLKTDDEMIIWGPLGNGFPALKVQHVGFVAGGIGQTPFLAYARQLLGSQSVNKVSLFYGARNEKLHAGVEDFEKAGVNVHLATDDGSRGYHGFVTELLLEYPMPDHLVGCGPEPMLHALTRIAQERQIPCHVSLETPMACGVGACFSCVTKIGTDDDWDYKRVCIDGPVFDASTWIIGEKESSRGTP